MSRKQKKRDGDFLLQGAILAVASIVVRVIGLIYRIPLTNILGDEGNGFYGYAFEIYSIALLISSYSLPLAVSKLVSARNARGEKRNAFRVFVCAFGFAVVAGLLVALVVFFGSDWISIHFLHAPYSAYPLRVLAFGLFIVAIMGVMRGYFQGLGTMIPTAISQIIEQVINAIVSLVGASYLLKMGMAVAEKKNTSTSLGSAYGAAGGTLGTVIGALSGCIFLIFVFLIFRKTILRQLKNDRTRNQESYGRIIKIILFTIAPVILSTAIYNISQTLDLVIFSTVMSGQGVEESKYVALSGIFTAKYNTLINIPLAIANALASSVIPSLTAAVSSGNKEQTFNKIQLAVRFAMLVAIPSFVGYVVLASPIMQLLYSDSRMTPALMLAIGAISIVFYCLSTVTNAVLQGINKMTTPVKNAAASLGIHIVAVLIMLVIFKMNIYSIVVGNIIFSFCMCLFNGIAIYKEIGYVQEVEKTFVKPLTAAVVMGVVTYAFHLLLDIFMGGRIATVFSLLVAVMVYAVSILKLGGLTEVELLSMPKGTLLVRYCKKLHLLSGTEE
ncbi:MAG: polysaccharide biosynthesis protein [Hespellia sp.]|nr:polysaccharide biosynthesis protein [Hespellia sp.]